MIGRMLCRLGLHDFILRYEHWQNLVWANWQCDRNDCEATVGA